MGRRNKKSRRITRAQVKRAGDLLVKALAPKSLKQFGPRAPDEREALIQALIPKPLPWSDDDVLLALADIAQQRDQRRLARERKRERDDKIAQPSSPAPPPPVADAPPPRVRTEVSVQDALKELPVTDRETIYRYIREGKLV